MATLRDDDHGLRTRLLLGELKIRGQHDDYDILSAATFGMVHDVQRSQPLRRVLSEKTGIERAGIQIRCRLKGAKGQRIATQFPQNPQCAASARTSRATMIGDRRSVLRNVSKYLRVQRLCEATEATPDHFSKARGRHA